MNRPDRVGKAFERCGVTGLALPNGEDSPTVRLQRLAVAIIAGAIGGDFGDPVRGVGLDLSPAVNAVGAAVPETAVNKDAGPAGGENEVGPPRQSARVEAVTQASGMKIPADGELGRGILTADRRHNFASPGGRYGVHGVQNSGEGAKNSEVREYRKTGLGWVK